MKRDFAGIPSALLESHQFPCVSLYMPTNRCHPESMQDRVRFRNLVSEALDKGIEMYGKRLIEPVIENIALIGEDTQFWNHTFDGLAIFASPDYYRVMVLQRSVKEMSVVNNRFHVNPLLRIFQSADRYQILALTRTDVKLYEGSRYALDEIPLDKAVPKTMTEALGSELTPPHQTIASFGSVGGESSMRHGHSSRKDEEELDNERFFRAVDRAVTECHSSVSRLPLIVAALPEHQSLFHEISHNPHLLADGIATDPRLMDVVEMRTHAWHILEPHYHAMIDTMVADYEEAWSKGLGEVDPVKIAASAVSGRVYQLLVESDRNVPGTLDPRTGGVIMRDASSAAGDDLLDELSVLVISKGGQVVMLPSEKMPSRTGLAAIYRY